MIEVSRFKLGLFVLGALALLVAALMVLGISERFAPKAKLVTYFTESVQGLDVGSPVKYKGVPIGRVSAIYIDTKDKKVRVDMDVDLKSFTVSNQESAMMSVRSFYDFCANERALGLRCRLDYSGLTGMKYIELDYFSQPIPDEARRPQQLDEVTGRCLIPSVPSTLTDILGKFNLSLEKIASVDFEGISKRMMDSLKEFSDILGDPNLKASITRLGAITANLEEISASMAGSITKEAVSDLMSALKRTLNEIDTLSAELSAQVKASRWDETSKAIRKSAVKFDDMQRDLSITAAKLNDVLDTVSSLANYLNEDPGALISGKSRPPRE